VRVIRSLIGRGEISFPTGRVDFVLSVGVGADGGIAIPAGLKLYLKVAG
jgi:hypothetical protein